MCIFLVDDENFQENEKETKIRYKVEVICSLFQFHNRRENKYEYTL